MLNPGWRTPPTRGGEMGSSQEGTPPHPTLGITPPEGAVLLRSFLHLALRGHPPPHPGQKEIRSPHWLGKRKVVDRSRESRRDSWQRCCVPEPPTRRPSGPEQGLEPWRERSILPGETLGAGRDLRTSAPPVGYPRRRGEDGTQGLHGTHDPHFPGMPCGRALERVLRKGTLPARWEGLGLREAGGGGPRGMQWQKGLRVGPSSLAFKI